MNTDVIIIYELKKIKKKRKIIKDKKKKEKNMKMEVSRKQLRTSILFFSF